MTKGQLEFPWLPCGHNEPCACVPAAVWDGLPLSWSVQGPSHVRGIAERSEGIQSPELKPEPDGKPGCGRRVRVSGRRLKQRHIAVPANNSLT